MRMGVLAVSFFFMVLLTCVGGAEFAFKQGTNPQRKNVELLKIAEKLNPFVSDYFYEDYRLTGDIKALRQAIVLEPTKPSYHMYYGLALMKQQQPRTYLGDQEAVTEICKAVQLKPYSQQYKDTCNQFRKIIPGS